MATETETETVTATWSNTTAQGWIVQKFGGTGVGKFPGNVGGPLAHKTPTRPLPLLTLVQLPHTDCPRYCTVRLGLDHCCFSSRFINFGEPARA